MGQAMLKTRNWLDGILNRFSGDAPLDLDCGLCEGWEPSNQVRAEFSFNLLLKFFKNVAYDLENHITI